MSSEAALLYEPLRVLQIEDSESDAALIVRALGKTWQNIRAERVENAAGLRRALGEEHWDVLIADYHLPQFDAPAALKILQETGKDIPFLVVSGRMGEDVAVAMMKSGAHDYVLKNDLTRLAPAVDREIREARVRRERKQAQQALERQSELVNLSHDAIITADENRVILAWNAGAEEMYGWKEAEAIGNVMHRLLHTPPASLADRDETIRHEGRWDGELVHTRRDGQQILVESRQVLKRDANGRVVGILEINRDVTSRKRAEATLQTTLGELESALKEKTVLLQEVHHRVKNNLAMICALLNMNAEATESQEARSALQESQQRVSSIALIHEQLYGTENFERVNFAEYTGQLVADLKVAFGAESRGITIGVQAEPVELGVHRAVPCALILQELLANAFKHAFPGQRHGSIWISFREFKPGHLELRVRDDGIGIRTGAEKDRGESVGSRIIGILTRQVDGTLEQESSNGTQFVLRFPRGGLRSAVGSA